MTQSPLSVRGDSRTSEESPWSVCLQPAEAGVCLGGAQNPVFLALQLSPDAIGEGLKALAESAATAASGHVDGSDQVTVSGGVGSWRVWVRPFDRNTGALLLHLRNDLDGDGQRLAEDARGQMSQDQPVVLAIPLVGSGETEYSFSWHGDIAYFREARRQFRPRWSGDLLVRWTSAPDREAVAPKVRLWTPQEAAHAATIGSVVQLRWEAQNCISAKLTGALPGGARVLDLEPDRSGNLAGDLLVRVMGLQIYILEAVVQPDPLRDVNVTVFRRLFLDVLSADQYAAVDTVQAEIFPNNPVTVTWAAWGVFNARLSIPGVRTIDVLQNNPGEHHFLEGQGSERLMPGNQKSQTVELTVETDRDHFTAKASFHILSWQEVLGTTDLPLGSAITKSAFCERDQTALLAFVDGDRLRLWDVGWDDRTERTHELEPLRQEGTAALSSALDSFFTLYPEDQHLRLMQFFPGYVTHIWETPLLSGDDQVQIAVAGGRAYIFGGERNGYAVWSAPVTPLTVRGKSQIKQEVEWKNEPLANGLKAHWLVLEEQLFAVTLARPKLLVYEPVRTGPVNGTLSRPLVHSHLTRPDGEAVSGVPVVIGKMIVFMGGDNPYTPRQKTTRAAKRTSTRVDYVYNTQTRQLRNMGREWDGQTAAVFRAGNHARLWGFFADACYTLAISDLSVFDEDYIPGNPVAKGGAPAFEQEYLLEIRNLSQDNYRVSGDGFIAHNLPPLLGDGNFAFKQPLDVGPGLMMPIYIFADKDGAPPTGQLCMLGETHNLLMRADFHFDNKQMGHASWRWFTWRPPLPTGKETGLLPVIGMEMDKPEGTFEPKAGTVVVEMARIESHDRLFVYNASPYGLSLHGAPEFADIRLGKGQVAALDYATRSKDETVNPPQFHVRDQFGIEVLTFGIAQSKKGLAIHAAKATQDPFKKAVQLTSKPAKAVDVVGLDLPDHLFIKRNQLLGLKSVEAFSVEVDYKPVGKLVPQFTLGFVLHFSGAYNKVEVLLEFPEQVRFLVIQPKQLKTVGKNKVKGVLASKNNRLMLSGITLPTKGKPKFQFTPLIERKGRIIRGETLTHVPK